MSSATTLEIWQGGCPFLRLTLMLFDNIFYLYFKHQMAKSADNNEKKCC